MHALYKCAVFLQNSPKERYQLCKQNRICINCLSVSHTSIKCNSTHSCRTCHSRHHTLLHFDNAPGFENENPHNLSDNVTPAHNTFVASLNAGTPQPYNLCQKAQRLKEFGRALRWSDRRF